MGDESNFQLAVFRRAGGQDDVARVERRGFARQFDGLQRLAVQQDIELAAGVGAARKEFTVYAGFSKAELDVVTEDNQLAVRGRQKEDLERQYLHRGIAARQFQRNFLLAEGVVVKGAELRNGMLIVELERPKVERTARIIEIRSA